MNLLVDTNIIIDYVGERQPFFVDSEKILATGYFKDTSLWMSAQSAKDTFYILSKTNNPYELQDKLLKLYNLVKPVSLDENSLRDGCRLKWKDYEDCLISLAAQKCNADYIITRDVKGFERSSVPAITPADWLALMKENGIDYSYIDFDE